MIIAYGKIAQTYSHNDDSTIRKRQGILKKETDLALLNEDKALLTQNYNLNANAYL